MYTAYMYSMYSTLYMHNISHTDVEWCAGPGRRLGVVIETLNRRSPHTGWLTGSIIMQLPTTACTYSRSTTAQREQSVVTTTCIHTTTTVMNSHCTGFIHVRTCSSSYIDHVHSEVCTYMYMSLAAGTLYSNKLHCTHCSCTCIHVHVYCICKRSHVSGRPCLFLHNSMQELHVHVYTYLSDVRVVEVLSPCSLGV